MKILTFAEYLSESEAYVAKGFNDALRHKLEELGYTKNEELEDRELKEGWEKYVARDVENMGDTYTQVIFGIGKSGNILMDCFGPGDKDLYLEDSDKVLDILQNIEELDAQFSGKNHKGNVWYAGKNPDIFYEVGKKAGGKITDFTERHGEK